MKTNNYKITATMLLIIFIFSFITLIVTTKSYANDQSEIDAEKIEKELYYYDDEEDDDNDGDDGPSNPGLACMAAMYYSAGTQLPFTALQDFVNYLTSTDNNNHYSCSASNNSNSIIDDSSFVKYPLYIVGGITTGPLATILGVGNYLVDKCKRIIK